MASPQSRGRVCWTDGEKQGEWLVDFLDPYDGNIEFCTLNRSFLGLDVVHITPLGENGQEPDSKEVERYEKRLEEVRIESQATLRKCVHLFPQTIISLAIWSSLSSHRAANLVVQLRRCFPDVLSNIENSDFCEFLVLAKRARHERLPSCWGHITHQSALIFRTSKNAGRVPDRESDSENEYETEGSSSGSEISLFGRRGRSGACSRSVSPSPRCRMRSPDRGRSPRLHRGNRWN